MNPSERDARGPEELNGRFLSDFDGFRFWSSQINQRIERADGFQRFSNREDRRGRPHEFHEVHEEWPGVPMASGF
jgi:hypothetical protein